MLNRSYVSRRVQVQKKIFVFTYLRTLHDLSPERDAFQNNLLKILLRSSFYGTKNLGNWTYVFYSLGVCEWGNYNSKLNEFRNGNILTPNTHANGGKRKCAYINAVHQTSLIKCIFAISKVTSSRDCKCEGKPPKGKLSNYWSSLISNFGVHLGMLPNLLSTIYLHNYKVINSIQHFHSNEKSGLFPLHHCKILDQNEGSRLFR